MYTKYFGFNEKPFTLTPNPRFIYLSKNHKEAFAHLLYGINNHYGFIELIGEVGTGKTTVLRTLLSQLQEESYRTALIVNPCLTGVELLRSICQEFGLAVQSEYVNDHLVAINNFLLSETSQGRTVVLVIDESQNLDAGVLEQIRLISNLETENDKLIQIVLAGQPELAVLLQRPELRQLNQRIAVRYRLKAMDMDETRAYLRHRMEVAGETGGVSFSPRATHLIFLYSRGIPRMINIVCDRSLLVAYGDERRRITVAVVVRAIRELLQAPQRKRMALVCAALLLVVGICITLAVNKRHLVVETKSAPGLHPAVSAASVDVKPAVASTPAEQQLVVRLKQELSLRGRNTTHLQAFNAIALKFGVSRITNLGGEQFTVPKMFSIAAAKRNLTVTEFKGTLDNVIRFNTPFLAVTKYADDSGQYSIAVMSAGKNVVTTTPGFYGKSTLSKNELQAIAAGTFYLVRKKPQQEPPVTESVQKTPFLSSSGSSL